MITRLKGYSLNHLIAGFVAVLVGYTSSAAIIFQAASAAGASADEIGSWMCALGIGMGVTSIGLSLAYRMPLFTAWSTPGAALLVTSLAGVSLPEAIGAFVLSSALILLLGVTGIFARTMNYMPPGIAAAMLAGVLVPFGLEVFRVMATDFTLVALMAITYLLLKRLRSRYTMMAVLAVGMAWSGWHGSLNVSQMAVVLALPVWVQPEFTWSTLIGVGIPLFVVTMTSQNIPGVAVLKAHGYQPPISPVISWTGGVGLLLAPFGAFALNLAAISAAICMGEEVDKDPAKRYWASVSGGVFYLVMGVLGATVSALFLAFPKALVVAVAGLALLGTIGNSLHHALVNESDREASLITFLVAASGVSLLGIGAAFWALVAGMLARAVLSPR